jgi:hypothetical protein
MHYVVYLVPFSRYFLFLLFHSITSNIVSGLIFSIFTSRVVRSFLR